MLVTLIFIVDLTISVYFASLLTFSTWLQSKDDSPAMTMHGKLKEPKKFQTPAPNKYEAILPEEQPSFAFGVKHSPYLYSGKQVTGDRWVSTKTEMGQKREEEFRPRSGTFTRDKPTVLRSTSAIRQSQAVA